MGALLAAAGNVDPQKATEALIFSGILIVIVVVGGVIAMWVRRRSTQASVETDPGTILESMRAMRASGELTEEEFQAARRRLIERVRAGDQPAEGPQPRVGPDGLHAPQGFDLTGAPLPKRKPDPDIGEDPTNGGETSR